MLSKKSIKILSIVLLVVMFLVMLGSTVLAVEVPKAADYTPEGDISTTVSKVLGIIKWAGIVAAVGVAMFIGIKYITSSPDGKAEVKKTLLIYVGGIVILLSASAIVAAIQTNLTIS